MQHSQSLPVLMKVKGFYLLISSCFAELKCALLDELVAVQSRQFKTMQFLTWKIAA